MRERETLYAIYKGGRDKKINEREREREMLYATHIRGFDKKSKQTDKDLSKKYI